VWALVLVVTIKYVVVIMRADNRGEGGLLALTALALRTTDRGHRRYLWIMAAGLVGAALFYGDGVITPAISVLSAVEGLKVATPLLDPYVIPISLVLLVGLFVVQRRGTAAIGGLFGPVMLVWFAVLATLGIWGIAQQPRILSALNPFYGLAQAWSLYPLVILASAATIIASQAVISGTFSLTRQAIQLGYLPRLEVRHTSETEIGQVYVPRINSGLLVTIIILVLFFQSSDNLGAAYGIAVSGMMLITTCLAFLYMRSCGWSLAVAVPVFGFFGLVDLTFLSANLLKIAEGGWFPIVIAALVFAVMGTWWRGRRILAELRARDAMPLAQFVGGLNPERPVRVPGTAVFLTRDLSQVPVALLHAMKH